MKLNRVKVKELMQIYCGGNYNKFGRELEIDPAHLHRFITTDVGGGKKIIFAIIKFY